MNQKIVITSINKPTYGVVKFAELFPNDVIVIGDKKTPENWELDNVDFVSIQEQEKYNNRFINLLPYNHYSRKMVGYWLAMKQGAELIIDTDDDNIPLIDYDFPEFDSEQLLTIGNLGFINIYKWFTSQFIWARGLPLNKVDSTIEDAHEEQVQVGIWQALANIDPDVDAIYRLILSSPCTFRQNSSIVLEQGTVSPINSQNTAWRKELFSLLYLPAFVSWRFTDILRGLVAQPILWAKGYRVGFTKATVYQERNKHDLMKDFEQEIPCYLYGEKAYEIANSVVSDTLSIEDNLYAIYMSLYFNKIVPHDELELLEAWLKEMNNI